MDSPEALFSTPRAGSLDEFLAALPLDDETRLEPGGSNADVRSFTLDSRAYVVKFLRRGQGLVDGHDLPTFVAKIAQIDLVHRRCPDLGARFVRLSGYYAGADGAALVMPFYQGRSICELLAAPESAGAFFAELAPILDLLIRDGYLREESPAAPGDFDQLYVQRVERRMGVLRRYLPAALLDAPAITINGTRCRTVPALLAALRARPDLLRRLDPPRLHFPAHGDLNLDNLLLKPGAGRPDFVILDPRGTIEPWDALYDFAKMLFTLTGFHQAMRSGFAIDEPAGTTASRPAYLVRLRAGRVAGFERAAARFVDFLAGLPAFQTLVRADPDWRLRLLYAHAFHALADASCRISDSKERRLGTTHGWAAQLELALGLHLMGNLLLERLLSAPEPPPGAIPAGGIDWQAAEPAR